MGNRFFAPVALLAAIVAVPAHAKDKEKPRITVDAEVVKVSPKPCCGSGIVAVWWWLDGKSQDRSDRYHAIYMGDEVLPLVGDRCTITFHVGAPSWVGGLEGADSAADLATARIIDEISCRAPDGRPRPKTESF